MPGPHRAPQLSPHPPVPPTTSMCHQHSKATASSPQEHPRVAHAHILRQVPSLPCPCPLRAHAAAPSCPRSPQQAEGAVLSPSASTSPQLSGQRGLVKQKEDSSSCLQPCLPPPGSAEHPAWPALPQVRPQRPSLWSPRPHPCPPLRTHEQRRQPAVPGLGGSLLLPQPRRCSRGSAKGMLCPARKHGRTQAAERNQEAARSTAPKSV